jgi:hypothetical protein
MTNDEGMLNDEAGISSGIPGKLFVIRASSFAIDLGASCRIA